jgi:hypothetical protein
MKHNRRLFLGVALVGVGILASSCAFLKAKRRTTRKDYIYMATDIVEEEADGKPAFPKGNTWQNYWKNFFQALRSSSTPQYSYEGVIDYVKALRAKKGLPPIE